MSLWSRARAQQAVGLRLARFTPTGQALDSRSRAPSRPATLSAEADLLARAGTSGQAFVKVPSYGELVAQDYEVMEDRLLAYLESNT